MRLILFTLTFGIFQILTAQTKLISYKSHSGNLLHFREIVANNSFDIGDSNLGLPSHVEINRKIDSVVVSNEKDSVFVFTSFKESSWKFKSDTTQYETVAEKFGLSKKEVYKNGDSTKLLPAVSEFFPNYSTKSTIIKNSTKSKKQKKSKIQLGYGGADNLKSKSFWIILVSVLAISYFMLKKTHKLPKN